MSNHAFNNSINIYLSKNDVEINQIISIVEQLKERIVYSENAVFQNVYEFLDALISKPTTKFRIKFGHSMLSYSIMNQEWEINQCASEEAVQLKTALNALLKRANDLINYEKSITRR